MGIMDNEGHDPMGFGNVRSARGVQTDPHAALKGAAEWCQIEREKIGAIDGYDYRSGEEYGLRRAQIELERRAHEQSQERKP